MKPSPVTVPVEFTRAPSDPVDQMTARILALNATLAALAVDASNPMLQSHAEKVERRRARVEVYGELQRCCAPPPEYKVAANVSIRGPVEPVLNSAGNDEREGNL